MDYILDRERSMDPSLPEMTASALKILTRDRDGFFLLVEGNFFITFKKNKTCTSQKLKKLVEPT